MHYSAPSRSGRKKSPLLARLGAAVRAARQERQLSRRDLAAAAGVSERFLAQLEGGLGNVSVLRLEDIAAALGTRAADLLGVAEAPLAPTRRVIALLGLRGAGKSTVGHALAERLGVPFVELDALVAQEAGMSLSTLFELHGEAHFRRLERDVLRAFLAKNRGAVLATSGSLVEDAQTYAMLRDQAVTVWLRARAKDHWDRVVAQGDGRPMRGRANARIELEELLRARRPLYEKAHATVDTSALALDAVVEAVVDALPPRTG